MDLKTGLGSWLGRESVSLYSVRIQIQVLGTHVNQGMVVSNFSALTWETETP